MCGDRDTSSKLERFESEPCPWCSEHPFLQNAYDQGGTWYQVVCANKKCLIQPTSQWGGKLAVIEAWNKPLRARRPSKSAAFLAIGLHGCP